MADNAYTLNTLNKSRVQILPDWVTRQFGYTHAFRLLYSDINSTGGQGDTVTVTLGSTPANYLLGNAAIYVKTAFATSSGSPTITGQLGITSATAALVSAASLEADGFLTGLTPLTDSTTGTASDTLAEIAALNTSDTYTDSAVNAVFDVVKNAIASIAAKLNTRLTLPVPLTGTSSTDLKLVITFEDAAGGEPDLLNAGELLVFLSMADLDAIQ